MLWIKTEQSYIVSNQSLTVCENSSEIHFLILFKSRATEKGFQLMFVRPSRSNDFSNSNGARPIRSSSMRWHTLSWNDGAFFTPDIKTILNELQVLIKKNGWNMRKETFVSGEKTITYRSRFIFFFISLFLFLKFPIEINIEPTKSLKPRSTEYKLITAKSHHEKTSWCYYTDMI